MTLDELEWKKLGANYRRCVLGRNPTRTIWDNGGGIYTLHRYRLDDALSMESWIKVDAITAQAVLNYLLEE